MTLLVVLAGIVVVFGVAMAALIKRLLYICSPNEVLIFSGGQRASSGKSVGYRAIKGGRAVRIPLLEAVDRIDLTNMPIEVAVTGAYSRGGIPLNVHGIANLKIAGEPPVLDNAIERFLGADRNQIMTVAKDVLEGNLRGVLATLTPEEVNQDKIKFAQSLLTEAEDDLRRIGIELDTLKIQDVSDDVGYLDSIGRRQSAEVQKTALIAEARSKSDAAVQAAANHRDTELSRLEALLGTLRADNARLLTDAETRTSALVAEARGGVAFRLARAQADIGVQQARVEQVRRQLQADILEPARARKAEAEANAKGAAATIIEQGRATAAAMDEIALSWHQVGDNARNVFLLQKVDGLMQQVMQTVSTLKVEKLTVLGGIGGGGLGTGGDLTGRVIAATEQIKAVAGVDLLASLRDRLTGGANPGK